MILVFIGNFDVNVDFLGILGCFNAGENREKDGFFMILALFRDLGSISPRSKCLSNKKMMTLRLNLFQVGYLILVIATFSVDILDDIL